MKNHLRLRFDLSTQHNFSWIISHHSIMQCDRVCIVIYLFAPTDCDILAQVLFDKLWMKISVGCDLALLFSPSGVHREGRKDIRYRAHENVRNAGISCLGNQFNLALPVFRQTDRDPFSHVSVPSQTTISTIRPQSIKRRLGFPQSPPVLFQLQLYPDRSHLRIVSRDGDGCVRGLISRAQLVQRLQVGLDAGDDDVGVDAAAAVQPPPRPALCRAAVAAACRALRFVR